MEKQILTALNELKKQCDKKDFCIVKFLTVNNFPIEFYKAVLKIGLVKERRYGKKYKYNWMVDNPTINDALFIKSYL